jgi:hypothetical protein
MKRNIGSNSIAQLMKNTDNAINIGQGIANHFYTQQMIDAKTSLIKELQTSMKRTESVDRLFKSDMSSPV